MRASAMLLLLLFALAPACRGDGKASDPTDPFQGPTGFQPGDPAPALTSTRLGKEDFAQVEGELRCIDLHFGEGTPEASKARRQAIEAWGADPEWVDGVRAHIASESAFAAKIEGALQRRMEAVCPGGKLTEAYVADLRLDGPSAAAATPAATTPAVGTLAADAASSSAAAPGGTTSLAAAPTGTPPAAAPGATPAPPTPAAGP